MISAVSAEASYNKEELRQLRKKLVKEQRRLKFRKFAKNRLSIIGLIIVAVMLITAICAPLITGALGVSYSKSNVRARMSPPSAQHWFGTDNMGRDVFARVVYGARTSMTVGFTVGCISGILGMILGLYASYYKALDNVLMRFCDGLKAIPNTLLAICLMAVLGADIKNVIISLSIVSTPNVARIARSAALVAREQTYVEAMRALGAKPSRILWLHIAPNILSPVIVEMTFTFASAIITEAALSFLGAGIPGSIPSWGTMLSEAKKYIYTSWWLMAFPGIFTALSVLGLNLLGDGIRDILDPLTN